jgi:hypothetical protein
MVQSILDDKQEPGPSAPPTGRAPLVVGIASAVLAVGALGAALVLFLQLRDARAEISALDARIKNLTAQASGTEARARDLDLAVAAVRGQTATIAERAGVTEAELERTAAAARQLREEQRKGHASLQNEVGKVKEDVAASKAAIEDTQAQLQRAVGDLGEQSGLIARNADELAALKRSNLRDYFEFDVRKSKQVARVGAVALRLKDADAKRHKFNMVLVVDDVEIEKKDKTLLEPVQFYRKGSRQIHEIVVYSVEKDRIVGYLSAPKAAEKAAP